MKDFIKNAITVKAEQYNGEPEQLFELGQHGLIFKTDESNLQIKSGNDYVKVEVGDYIVMNVEGEFLVMNQDRFNKTYSASELSDEKETASVGSDKTEPTEANSENKNPDEYDNSSVTNDNNKKLLKKLYPYYVLILFNIVMLAVVTISTACINKKNIENVVAEANKELIEKESNELLKRTEKDAEQLIIDAKIKAKEEADKTFREEMKRLTEEKVGK